MASPEEIPETAITTYDRAAEELDEITKDLTKIDTILYRLIIHSQNIEKRIRSMHRTETITHKYYISRK